MGRGTTRRPKPKERSGPSWFFLIALALGIAVLVVVFFQMNSRPAAAPHGMAQTGRVAVV
jgi:hypothetical protein